MRRLSRGDFRVPLQVKYRAAYSMIVPYVELSLHKAWDGSREEPMKAEESPIRAIIVGPSPHAERLRDVAEQLSLSKGLRIPVYTSSVPYRNW